MAATATAFKLSKAKASAFSGLYDQPHVSGYASGAFLCKAHFRASSTDQYPMTYRDIISRHDDWISSCEDCDDEVGPDGTQGTFSQAAIARAVGWTAMAEEFETQHRETVKRRKEEAEAEAKKLREGRAVGMRVLSFDGTRERVGPKGHLHHVPLALSEDDIARLVGLSIVSVRQMTAAESDGSDGYLSPSNVILTLSDGSTISTKSGIYVSLHLQTQA